MQSKAVRWLTMALEDLHAIASFLTEQEEDAAHNVAKSIWDTGSSLAALPSRGRPGRLPGTREIVLTNYPYFLAYRVVKSEVQILRVLHTARQYPQ